MQEKLITSRKNEIVKATVNLISSADKRKEMGLFVAEGARLCEDAAKSGTRIVRLFYTKKALEKYDKYISLVKQKSEEIFLIEEHIASAISSTKNSQEVFAVCQIPKIQGVLKGKVLVMEKLQDPTNLGTILRTGEALGIGTFVLLGDCCDVYSPKVARGSMGAVFRLNILKFDKLEDLKIELEKNNYQVYSAVPNEKALDITKIKFADKTAVFVGNEGNGLTAQCIDSFLNITIPMKGRAESLNASSAASVIMWELVRDV